MNKLDSMWYHEGKNNGELASSHIFVFFCALVRSGMVVSDLLEMEFENVPRAFDDETISPMEYCLAYTDGEILDVYIKSEYRESVSDFYENNEFSQLIYDEAMFEHDTKNEAYTLKCTWHNVNALARELERRFHK